MKLADLDSGTDGAQLLDQLHAALIKYVVFPSPEAADAVTLWIAATHAQPAWEHATRLLLKSPEKRCGKTRLLEVIKEVAHRPRPTVNISAAALVRTIDDKNPPTLIVDEADTLYGSRMKSDVNEDLTGILNSGFSRGWPYTRYNAAKSATEDFPTYAMAVLASKAVDLPDALEDRSVIITMRRRAPGEAVAPFRARRDAPPLRELQECMHDWLEGSLDDLQEAEPELPVEDRAADCWESLAAIADLAGGAWPKRARRACAALTAKGEADARGSQGIRLLADLHSIAPAGDFAATRDLIDHLCKIDESPWRDLGLSARALSDMLRPYGIKPCSDGKARGYRIADFADAFARYLPSETVNVSETTDDLREHTDGSEAPDGSNRQAAETVMGLTSHSDALTGPDGTPAQIACTICGGPLAQALIDAGYSDHGEADAQ